MRLFLFTLLALGTLGANTSEPFNGHLIKEPRLSDYHQGERKPGFSSITEIIDSDGNPVASR